MMIRALLFLLVSASVSLRASEPISVPGQIYGASATVKQPHVTAELIPEAVDLVGVYDDHFDVILHLHSDPGWHTYWINPGDAGLATKIKWTLPEGFTAGPIQWPTPEKHKMGPLVTYGYEGDVYLLTTITCTKKFVGEFHLKAKASWLVCQEECIPGKAEFDLKLERPQLFTGLPGLNTALFEAARMRLPVPNKGWDVSGAYGTPPELGGMAKQALEMTFKNKAGRAEKDLGNLQFFPEQPNILDAQAQPRVRVGGDQFKLWISLIQNGDRPDEVSGVLVSDVPLVSEKTGDSHAVYIPAFSTKNLAETPTMSSTKADSASPSDSPSSVAVAGPATEAPREPTAPPLGTAAATSEHRPPVKSDGGIMDKISKYFFPEAYKGDAELNEEGGAGQKSAAAPPMGTSAATSEVQPLLIAVLGAAFIGGLILNLMPCVLPVLSLKVFSLMKHAEKDHSKAWKQGAAFTAGVVISFWILAGLLLALRAAGNHLGWGFQMQSPGFVLVLIFIFFLLALNLFGVFELGTSLVGLDAKVTGKSHGLTSSFLNGALATLAATPCTAPFMGSSLGFAAQQPAYIALLIFTFLALGMAAPYMLLTIFPGALKFVPKPGAWMEALKQFMGFLLMATVVFLLYVFGALMGEDQIPWALGLLLFAGLAAWIYGRWSNPAQTPRNRGLGMVASFLMLFFTGISALIWISSTPLPSSKASSTDFTLMTIPGLFGTWHPWSDAAVQKQLADGHPVFVDFTAAWCLSCKVNEKVALESDSVKEAFNKKGVVLFKADWTHSDPEISKALQQYNRDGVPLYLLYSPKDPTKPQVLPEVLTPGIVLDALNKL